MSTFFAELKRRNVFKVGIAYAIVAWLLIEVASTVLPTFHAPDWVLQTITFVIILGFPLALIFAWAFELTPEGIKPAATVDPTGKDSILSGRRMDFLIIGLLVLVVIFLVTDNYVLNSGARDAGLRTREEMISDTNNQGQMTIDTTEKSTEPAAVLKPAPNTIAILPFMDMSPNKDQEYFADGLTEELLNKLAQVKDLTVIGRTSSFFFKNKNIDLREIGNTLGVAHLLEGSVRKAGNQLRITAQLVKAEDGSHLWSGTYERSLTDVFSIQDDIAYAVTRALSITLGAGEFNRPGMTNNVTAYEEYLQSLTGDLQERIDHAEQALNIDPSFALAWSSLSRAYAQIIWNLPPEKTDEYRKLASEALERAKAISPELPEVLLTTAQEMAVNGNWLEADRIYQQILKQSNNSNVAANLAYGHLLLSVGLPKESLEFLQRARRLDPLRTDNIYDLTLALMTLKRFDEALNMIETGIALDKRPNSFWLSRWLLAMANGDKDDVAVITVEVLGEDNQFVRILRSDDIDASLDEIRNYLTNPDNTVFNRAGMIHIAAKLGDPQLAIDILNQQFIPNLEAIWLNHMRDMRRLPAFKTGIIEAGLLDYWRTTSNWGDFCHPVGEDDFECE